MRDDMGARRFWMYEKGSWSGPLVMRGGDEFGNSTLAVRLPGGRALAVAWNIPLRRELEPFEARMEYGLIGGPDDIGTDNPLPTSRDDALLPIPGWHAVRRELWMTRWERVDPVDDPT